MHMITHQPRIQIESDRPPFLCGACNFYADCFVRREEDEPSLFSLQFEYCHKEKEERSYLPDDELILLSDELPEGYWECDCDENFTHKLPEEVCPECGIKYYDPTE